MPSSSDTMIKVRRTPCAYLASGTTCSFSSTRSVGFVSPLAGVMSAMSNGDVIVLGVLFGAVPCESSRGIVVRKQCTTCDRCTRRRERARGHIWRLGRADPRPKRISTATTCTASIMVRPSWLSQSYVRPRDYAGAVPRLGRTYRTFFVSCGIVVANMYCLRTKRQISSLLGKDVLQLSYLCYTPFRSWTLPRTKPWRRGRRSGKACIVARSAGDGRCAASSHLQMIAFVSSALVEVLGV